MPGGGVVPRTSRVYTSQLGYSGATPVVYDDLQTGGDRLFRPGGDDPTWGTSTYGIGGGVAFSALGFALNDYAEYFVQTTHGMKLNTVLDAHVHYTLPSDSASDRIKFQIDVIAAPIGSDYAAPAGTPFSAEVVLDGTEAGKHNLIEVADIPAVNTTVSTIYICRLTRVAASASDYAPVVYVTFVDCHFQKDTSGSLAEDSKT
jgi:hypothetical protein